MVRDAKRRDLKRSYRVGMRNQFNARVNPTWAERDVTTITPDDFEALWLSWQADGLAPKTIYNIAGYLHRALEFAVADGVILANPVDLGTLPRIRRDGRFNVLSVDELELVLSARPSACDADEWACLPATGGGVTPQQMRDGWPTVRVGIMIAAMAGLRHGEVIALRWSDHGYRLHVRESFVKGVFDAPKSRAGFRSIPLAPRLNRELERHRANSPWNGNDDLVVANPRTGRPFATGRLTVHFKAALRRVGLAIIRFHDLRHTFATTLAGSGQVPLRALQEYLGHESLQTTQIYSHYQPARHEGAVIGRCFEPERSSCVATP